MINREFHQPLHRFRWLHMLQIKLLFGGADFLIHRFQCRYIQALFVPEMVIDHAHVAFRPRHDGVDASTAEAVARKFLNGGVQYLLARSGRIPLANAPRLAPLAHLLFLNGHRADS